MTQLLIEPPAFRDVARNVRGTHNAAAGVANGRDGERDIDQVAAFGAPDGFEVVYGLPACDGFEDFRFFVGSILGQQECHSTANGLRRCVAVYAFSAGVPAEDGAVKSLANDGVFG